MDKTEIKALIAKERARLVELYAIACAEDYFSGTLSDALEEIETIEHNLSVEVEALAAIHANAEPKITAWPVEFLRLPCRNPIRYITIDANFIIVYRDVPRIYKCNARMYAKIVSRTVTSGGRLIPVRALCADNGGCVCG